MSNIVFKFQFYDMEIGNFTVFNWKLEILRLLKYVIEKKVI